MLIIVLFTFEDMALIAWEEHFLIMELFFFWRKTKIPEFN